MTAVRGTEHTDLRRLAEAATPGPWSNTPNTSAGQVWVEVPKPKQGLFRNRGVLEPIFHVRTDAEYAQRARDAAFIAAANPRVVLSLLEERDALRKECSDLRAAVREAIAVTIASLLDAAEERDRLREALETIVGPEDAGPWIGIYREAGGGYQGLQAIARAALSIPQDSTEGGR